MVVLGGLGSIWGVVLGATRWRRSTASCCRASSTTPQAPWAGLRPVLGRVRGLRPAPDPRGPPAARGAPAGTSHAASGALRAGVVLVRGVRGAPRYRRLRVAAQCGRLGEDGSGLTPIARLTPPASCGRGEIRTPRVRRSPGSRSRRRVAGVPPAYRAVLRPHPGTWGPADPRRGTGSPPAPHRRAPRRAVRRGRDERERLERGACSVRPGAPHDHASGVNCWPPSTS